MKDTKGIAGWHAHVYFDEATMERARDICTRAAEQFGAQMGRMHQRPIGPHPDWSCQLAFGPERSGEIIGWLATNRQGLVILVHPETGDELADHTDHAIWMGAIRPLDVSIFKKA